MTAFIWAIFYGFFFLLFKCQLYLWPVRLTPVNFNKGILSYIILSIVGLQTINVPKSTQSADAPTLI